MRAASTFMVRDMGISLAVVSSAEGAPGALADPGSGPGKGALWRFPPASWGIFGLRVGRQGRLGSGGWERWSPLVTTSFERPDDGFYLSAVVKVHEERDLRCDIDWNGGGWPGPNPIRPLMSRLVENEREGE